jgi:hypothetical protein
MKKIILLVGVVSLVGCTHTDHTISTLLKISKDEHDNLKKIKHLTKDTTVINYIDSLTMVNYIDKEKCQVLLKSKNYILFPLDNSIQFNENYLKELKQDIKK